MHTSFKEFFDVLQCLECFRLVAPIPERMNTKGCKAFGLISDKIGFFG